MCFLCFFFFLDFSFLLFWLHLFCFSHWFLVLFHCWIYKYLQCNYNYISQLQYASGLLSDINSVLSSPSPHIQSLFFWFPRSRRMVLVGQCTSQVLPLNCWRVPVKQIKFSFPCLVFKNVHYLIAQAAFLLWIILPSPRTSFMSHFKFYLVWLLLMYLSHLFCWIVSSL